MTIRTPYVFNERAVQIHEKAMKINPQDTSCWLGRGAMLFIEWPAMRKL